MLQNNDRLLVHKVTNAFSIDQTVGLWGVNGTLESAKRLENRHQLSIGVANIDLRVVAGIKRFLVLFRQLILVLSNRLNRDQKVALLLNSRSNSFSEVLWITKSWHFNKLINKCLVLLHD